MNTISLRFARRLPALAHLRCAIYVSAVALAACGEPATDDLTVIDNPVPAADTDDTAPGPAPYDASLTYRGRYQQDENHSTERFRFDVAAYTLDSERQRGENLYASHAGFLSASQGEAIPSVQTIGTYVKQLDDTLYAGVERAVQDGLQPTLEPKRTILTGALQYLSDHRSVAGDDAIVLVAAAVRLGGEEPVVPADLVAKVAALQSEFLASTMESKPVGFYTGSEALKQIWQQDRLLQRTPGDASTSCALAAAIAADPVRRQRYVQLTQVYSRLTNPLHSSLVSMLDIAAEPSCLAMQPQAFLSTSETSEVALFDKLYPNGIPADADLMGDLIKAIRAGTVDLAPKPDDGWYQYQSYALETLLVTDKSEERGKVAFMARYKKRLQEAFSTMLTQHRETHAKQADMAGASTAMPMMPLTPHFRLEPLATVYVRHARSYVFLESALDTVLGGTVLDAAVAVVANGSTTETLRTRIHNVRDLFFGLYLDSCQDLGLKPALASVGDPDPADWTPLATAADSWLLNLASDPLTTSDVRVIIPIAWLDTGRAKYWAVIGVRGTLAGYSYIGGMDVSPPKPEDQSRTWLPTEQFLEVESSPTPLSREEFRALCDQAVTADGIKAALEARQ